MLGLCPVVRLLQTLTPFVRPELTPRARRSNMIVQSSVYWLSWFTVNMVIVLISSLLEVAFGIAFEFNVFTNASFAVRPPQRLKHRASVPA